MKHLFLALILFITILGCDDTKTKYEIVCEGVECSEHGECTVKEDRKAVCVCDAGFHAEGLECKANTLQCGVTEHEEAGACVSNHKMVDCIDVTPVNATTMNIQTEITWENGTWSNASNCEWYCNENYHKSGNSCVENTLQCEDNQHEEENGCVDNTKTVDCNDVTPEHGVKVDSQVEITWENGVWSNADNCDFSCEEGFSKIDNRCITIPQDYAFITPQLDEKLTASSLFVSWVPPEGTVQDIWLDVGSEPYPSEARSDIKNIHLNDDFLITSYTVTELPEDGRVLYLSLSYKISNEWLSISRKFITAGEPLNCENNQHEEENGCVDNAKIVDCNDITPEHGVKVDSQVEIIWRDGDWSIPENCDFNCDEGYNKVEEHCIENGLRINNPLIPEDIQNAINNWIPKNIPVNCINVDSGNSTSRIQSLVDSGTECIKLKSGIHLLNEINIRSTGVKAIVGEEGTIIEIQVNSDNRGVFNFKGTDSPLLEGLSFIGGVTGGSNLSTYIMTLYNSNTDGLEIRNCFFSMPEGRLGDFIRIFDGTHKNVKIHNNTFVNPYHFVIETGDYTKDSNGHLSDSNNAVPNFWMFNNLTYKTEERSIICGGFSIVRHRRQLGTTGTLIFNNIFRDINWGVELATTDGVSVFNNKMMGIKQNLISAYGPKENSVWSADVGLSTGINEIYSNHMEVTRQEGSRDWALYKNYLGNKDKIHDNFMNTRITCEDSNYGDPLDGLDCPHIYNNIIVAEVSRWASEVISFKVPTTSGRIENNSIYSKVTTLNGIKGNNNVIVNNNNIYMIDNHRCIIEETIGSEVGNICINNYTGSIPVNLDGAGLTVQENEVGKQ